MTNHNPLVEFAQWLSLARDLARVRSLRALLGHLAMPPGWAPDGPGETTEALRARAAQPQPAATDSPAAWRASGHTGPA